MATTLSAIVLRGRRFYLAHVGDTGSTACAASAWNSSTTDHVWEHPAFQNVLSRAVGLDAHVQVDYADGDLETGDVFALMSDGVGQLGDRKIRDILKAEADPQEAAARLAMGAGTAAARTTSPPWWCASTPSRPTACATTSPAHRLPLPRA